ncbi:hypothetical protein [Streptomyces sp. NPDC059072]
MVAHWYVSSAVRVVRVVMAVRVVPMGAGRRAGSAPGAGAVRIR